MLIVSLALAGLSAGAVVTFIMKPTYTSETQLFVAIQNTGSVEELQTGNSFTQARVQSYVKVVTTPAVLRPVIEDLGLETTPGELAERITAESGLDTVLITISAKAGTAEQAANIAQAVSGSLVETVENLESSSPSDRSPVRLSIVTPATPPNEASAPNTMLNLAFGLLLGLAGGLSVSVLRAKLDTTVRGEADLRSITDAPFLGGLTFDDDARKKPLVTQIPAQSPRAEAFRHLRTNMQFANIGGASSATVVTSSLPGEGKSTTAINLSISLAQAGQTVALVDADLRRPMVSGYLGLEGNAGLTTTLIGRAEVNDLLQPWGSEELYVLAAGQIPPNPSELLGSEAMLQLIRGLEATFDAVIIDAPPLLPVTDAAVLSQNVGGVILVAGSGEVKTADVEKSLTTLEMVDANLLGIVLNKLPAKGPDAYRYSAYSYQSDMAVETGSARTTQARAAHRPFQRSEMRKTRDGARSTGSTVRQSTRMTDSFDEQVLQGGSNSPSTFPTDGNRRY